MIDHYEELLPIRMALPEFSISTAELQVSELSPITTMYIEQLLDLGFIFSHELFVNNPVGKYENETSRVITYLNVDANVYALVSDLYHINVWVQFTSYYAAGQRIVTTGQPGALMLEPIQHAATADELFVQNTGSNTIDSQWKKHRRLTADRFADENALLLQPDQHLAIERGFYLRYVTHLLDNSILQQTDTQTIRFTRSGARAFYAAITSRSARAPQPQVEEWIGKRGKIPIRQHFSFRNVALVTTVVLASVLIISLPRFLPPVDTIMSQVSDPFSGSSSAAKSDPADTIAARLNAEPATAVTGATMAKPQPQKSIKQTPAQVKIASREDEMWRIAVENAEFYLLSNDGDPAPWIRTARKIAAGFKSNDSRLARTYFLGALLERDHKVAEAQYNRALNIQTKTLGLYHHETAQTLEALAWIAERNKEALDEAITHQRLAVNIYRDIYGSEAEDTKAAIWKLEYFEDRLAGARPKTDTNNRLLPALARFATD